MFAVKYCTRLKSTPCFEKYGSLVCRSRKPLYGWKQAPEVWYEKIDHFFLNLSFKNYDFDHIIYALHVNGETSIVALYVNDLVINGSNVDFIMVLKKQ
jgi:hypothetical protein